MGFPVVCPQCDGDRFFRLGDGEDDTTDCGLCAGVGMVVTSAETDPDENDDELVGQDDQSWRELSEADIRAIRDA